MKFKRYQSRAGNYLVIDGERTSYDYAYMHLRDAALVDQGDRVHTGQLIGFVGDTGRADGCHLHFEVWTGAGLVQRRPRGRPAAAVRPGTRLRRRSAAGGRGSPADVNGGWVGVGFGRVPPRGAVLA